uniref:Uncharacterized protein n=1 Tax=Heterorhabditis bacteriophora TaxID=37862 RepID=A0A1I7XB54_HETBA
MFFYCSLLVLLLNCYAQDVPAVLDVELEPFSISLADLEKDSKPVTTLNEQCKRFINHYRYYCRTSNIATYNEEVRIICERYRTYCSDRVYPSVNHIRRQLTFWRESGLPIAAQKSLTTCYAHCKETDPVWAQKCRAVWKPLPDYTPADSGIMSPHPIVRGQFYGYDGLGNYRTFNRPRDHGVSFYRGTNTVLVDWPEGKITGATTWDVPFAGVNGIFNAYDIGFPNLQRGYKEFTKFVFYYRINIMLAYYWNTDNLDSVNPGTGRKRSAMSTLRRN